MNLIERIRKFYKRRGLKETFLKGGKRIVRDLMRRDLIIFCCYVDEMNYDDFKTPGGYRFLKIRKLDDLSKTDGKIISESAEVENLFTNYAERLSNGSTLWLLKSEEKIIAFRWTIRGRTIKPYVFPLSKDDAYVFDSYVFPEFRGKNINGMFHYYMMQELQKEGVKRTIFDVHEWNKPQLNNLKKYKYTRLGVVRKYRVLNKEFIYWKEI